MKIIFTLSFCSILVTAAFSQEFTNPDNELHAPASYIRHSSPPVKWYHDDAPYANINISQNAAPQNEPSVRISRVNPDIVVAAWRDFRLGYQGSNTVRRIGYSFSHDGGATWAPSQLLPDPNPDHTSQSDPVVTSDMAGHFYISSTSRQPVNNYNREMLLYKSMDNGQTFDLHAIAVPGSGAQGEDKEWLFCDPVPANPTYDHLMMVWRSFGPTYGIRFRKSDVGGSNWSGTKIVSDYNSGQGANITTGVNGEIIVVWKDYGIWMDRSLDGGETFGQDVEISSYSWDNYSSFPFICTDYSNENTRGNIYLVWADSRQGNDDIWFQRSGDGGSNWLNSPVRINDVPTGDQFWPAIQCDTTGRIYVIYYDDRDYPGLYSAWLAWSDDAGNSWSNYRLSESSIFFNMPNTEVRFGDYIHLDAYAGKAVPVWTDDRTGDYDQEIYTALVDLTIALDEYNKPTRAAVLYQNYPNPFSEMTLIRLTMEQKGEVELVIQNSLGQPVKKIFEGQLEPGEHEFLWENYGDPGVYFCVLHTGQGKVSRKMISLK